MKVRFGTLEYHQLRKLRYLIWFPSFGLSRVCTRSYELSGSLNRVAQANSAVKVFLEKVRVYIWTLGEVIIIPNKNLR